MCVACQWVKAEWNCVLLINSLCLLLPPSATVRRIAPLVAMVPSSNPSQFVCLCGLKGISTLMQGWGARPLLRKVSVCRPVCACVCVWLECLSLAASETELHSLFISHTIYWPHFKFVSSTVNECFHSSLLQYGGLRLIQEHFFFFKCVLMHDSANTHNSCKGACGK